MTASPVTPPMSDPRLSMANGISAPSDPRVRTSAPDGGNLPGNSGAVTGRKVDEGARRELHSRLIASLDLSTIGTRTDAELRAEIRSAAEELCLRGNNLLTAAERDQLVDEVMDETFGLGPLEKLLRDPAISDILINGPKTIFCERRGRLEKSEVTFESEDHLLQIIQRIVSRVGRRVDATSPMVDARLADGSRVNAIIPPPCSRWISGFDSSFSRQAIEGRRPDRQEVDCSRDGGVSGGSGESPQEHSHLGRHRFRQDDALEPDVRFYSRS